MIEYRARVTSQFGQDGVLAELFRRIGAGSQWCVEVGAYDGHHYSNTWSLINQAGWHGVLLEGHPARAAALAKRYELRPDVWCIEQQVPPEGLDRALGPAHLPQPFDLLCLDVDGDDWHLWANLEKHRPRAVLVEFNPTFGPDVIYVPKPGGHMGCSAAALVKLASQKGYRLACCIEIDLLFVAEDEFEQLRLVERSLAEHLCLSERHVPRLVSDLDGVHYLLRAGPWGAREDEDQLHSEFLKSRADLAATAEVLEGAPRLWEGGDGWPLRV